MDQNFAESSLMNTRLGRQLAVENPLQVVGVINAYSALLAESSGFNAIYLSGAGVANASFGLPDLGMTSLNDVAEEASRITEVTDLPLLVDADTGWGDVLNIGRTVKLLTKAGAAGMHIEDQVQNKRCGHRPNKVLVSCQDMADRIKASVDARIDPQFTIMARTDAYAIEGMSAAIDRANAYVEAGAEMIFAESLITLIDFETFTKSVSVPVLANMTEFGNTNLYHIAELKDAGVKLILYPLSAFRAMSQAALQVYQTIRLDGSQKNVIKQMQTREQLYKTLNYHDYEKKLDRLFDRNDQ